MENAVFTEKDLITFKPNILTAIFNNTGIDLQAQNEKQKELVLAEYKISKLGSSLHAKKPVFAEVEGKLKAFFLMRKITGEPLTKCLINNKRKPFTMSKRIALTKALLRALKSQVTDLGLVHCDIKPCNIMVENFKVTIIDFGNALLVEEKKVRPRSTFPTYMSPELSRHTRSSNKEGHTLTPKTDVYSLGKILGKLWEDNPSQDMHTFLNTMVAESLEERFCINEAIESFEELSENLIKARLEFKKLKQGENCLIQDSFFHSNYDGKILSQSLNALDTLDY